MRGWSHDQLDWLRALAPAELRRSFRILPADLLADGPNDDLGGMGGEFEVGADLLLFRPRHPFLAGTRYALVGPRGNVWTLESQRTAAPQTAVEAIHPSARELPLNVLRLYIHFSAPMSEGWARRAVQVRRLSGELIEGALLEMDPELWDPGRRRLTVLFEPGRIKRGLVPNLEAGYPLSEGQSAVVSVERSFRDAAGQELRSGAERSYLIGPPLRQRVEPARWRWWHPALGSREPLRLHFDRPLDHALLAGCLRVLGPAGELVGRAEAGSEERSWSFVPEQPWQPGQHALQVDTRLEDVAGNSVRRVFDRDLTRPEDDPMQVAGLSLPFEPAPGRA